jgi:hypothetical protein
MVESILRLRYIHAKCTRHSGLDLFCAASCRAAQTRTNLRKIAVENCK